jgi:hypothetical protein
VARQDAGEESVADPDCGAGEEDREEAAAWREHGIVHRGAGRGEFDGKQMRKNTEILVQRHSFRRARLASRRDGSRDVKERPKRVHTD